MPKANPPPVLPAPRANSASPNGPPFSHNHYRPGHPATYGTYPPQVPGATPVSRPPVVRPPALLHPHHSFTGPSHAGFGSGHAAPNPPPVLPAPRANIPSPNAALCSYNHYGPGDAAPYGTYPPQLPGATPIGYNFYGPGGLPPFQTRLSVPVDPASGRSSAVMDPRVMMNFPLYQHSTMVNLIIECEKIIAAFSFLRVAITSLLMMAFLSLLRVSFKTLCRSRKPFFHVEEISLYSHPTFTPYS